MKKFIADFHIHSKYSHATSKFMDLLSLSVWGQLKGIMVMGTGDFTHPQWQKELRQHLCEVEQGLFELQPSYQKAISPKIYDSCKSLQRFMLTSEVSTIFKRNGRCYRVHSLILAPDFATVEKISQKLAQIGNIVHDGRPILGCDVKEIVKIALTASPECMVIPAHIWTPWFGLLGSKSGFNSVQEAFEELTPYIFAVEKGLSSNFLMNAQISSLDNLAILCNSDAHSVQNLGREANLMHTAFTYDGIVQAIRSNDPERMVAGIEFFPERGKYYADGHRACNIVLTPQQTKKAAGLCPACGKPVVVGVLNRIEQLADRTIAQAQNCMRRRYRVVPLFDLLQQALNIPVTNPKIMKLYHKILADVGNEFFVLLKADIDQIAQAATPDIARAIEKLRQGEVKVHPGYDGVYGHIEL